MHIGQTVFGFYVVRNGFNGFKEARLNILMMALDQITVM